MITAAMHKPPPTRPPSAPPVYRPVIVIPRANVRMISSIQPVQPKPLPGIPAARELHTPRPYTVVQARMQHGQPKIYPNLNPAAAALKVDPGEFMKLDSSFDQNYFRMRRGSDHGVLVPNSKYIFVQTMDGETVMHQRYRHPVLAQGKPVLYAGEAYFNNGRLDWWSNGSGNYRPDSDHAEQAGLPMEKFFTYEQVLKGAHKQT
jgi:hypothetical protein